MKRLVIAVVFLFGLGAQAWAHPPTDLEAVYDADQKVLTVKMRHVSHDIRDHYIRFITVTVNQEKPHVFRYTHQEYPSYVDVLLNVDAKPGDMIHISAQCIKGGNAKLDLQVPVEEDQPTEQK